MAKIYLDSTDTAFIIVDGNSYVYGADNNQTITIGANAKNVVTDQNIEKVVFSGATNDYTYAQSGNQMGVYKNGTLITTVPLQGDSNGTEFQFSNGTTNAKLTSGVMTIGGGTLTSTPAAVVMTDPAITTTTGGGGSDTTSPTLSSSSPADDAASVAVSGNIVLTFSESVSAVSGKNILIKKTADNSTVATMATDDTTKVSISGGVVTINPASDLTAGSSYYVLIDNGAFKDAQNNVYGGISNTTTLNFTTATTPDTTNPTVSSIAIVSATGVVSNTLNAGDVVTVTVGFSENVTITGTPNLGLNIGGSTVQAAYASGTGTNSLTFSYTILAAQTDANGISVDANALALNSGTIKDAAGNNATLTHGAVTDSTSYKVDTTAPTANLATVTDNVGSSTGVLISGATTDDTTLDMVGTCESGSSVKIYNGSTLLGSATVSGTGWTYKASVISGATHQLNVKETDMAGNESAATSNFAATVVATAVITTTLDSAAVAKSVTDTNIDTASFLATSNNIIQSLVSGSQWTSSPITYSFNTTMPSEYTDRDDTTGWQPVNATAQSAVEQIMTMTDSIIASTINKATMGDGDIRYNMIIGTDHAYYPTSSIGGDVFLSNGLGVDATVSSNVNIGKFGASIIIHELGHALGLKHPFENGATLPTVDDNHIGTLMSYTSYKGLEIIFTRIDNGGGSYSPKASHEYAYPKSFMIYDIAALQNIYGADTTTQTGDNIYAFGTTPFYESIWDAGGTDTLDFSATTFGNTIKLTPGSYSNVNYRDIATQISVQQAKYQTELSTSYLDNWVATVYNYNASLIYTGEKALGIAYGAVIENAIGGSAGDSFYDNSVNNSLTGNAGDDIFYLGAGGYDTVDGGAGSADKIVLAVNKADTQMESKGSGVTLLVGSTFAVSLTGVETIQFADQLYTVA